MQLLKSVIKNLPDAKWAARRIRAGAADGVGEWLYRQEVVAWLYRPELRRQMPLLYRGFGRYARAFAAILALAALAFVAMTWARDRQGVRSAGRSDERDI